MAAPILITSYQVDSAAADLVSLVSPSFTPTDDEVIIIKVASENFDTPSIGNAAGGGLTYSTHVSFSSGNQSSVRIMSAVVGTSPGSMTVTVTFTGLSGWHAMVVERWSGAAMAGSPATVSTTSAGAPLANIVTTADDSIVSWAAADWNATAPGTPAYRSSAIEDGLHDKSPGNYVGYFAYQVAATAGSQTIGLTAPTGQNATLGGVEILSGGDTAPVVTTEAVTDIASSTATGNGTVVSDGGDTIIERGVCWSISPDPTTSDSKATSAGTTGSFTSSITGLSSGTLYHVRAYAINSIGTSYGADVTFQHVGIDIAWITA